MRNLKLIIFLMTFALGLKANALSYKEHLEKPIRSAVIKFELYNHLDRTKTENDCVICGHEEVLDSLGYDVSKPNADIGGFILNTSDKHGMLEVEFKDGQKISIPVVVDMFSVGLTAFAGAINLDDGMKLGNVYNKKLPSILNRGFLGAKAGGIAIIAGAKLGSGLNLDGVVLSDFEGFAVGAGIDIAFTYIEVDAVEDILEKDMEIN